MRLPSPSKLDLAHRCAYPFTSGIQWPGYVGDDRSTFGKCAHKYSERVIKGEGPTDAESLCDEYEIRLDSDRARLERVTDEISEILLADEYVDRKSEISLAYDPFAETVRELRADDRKLPTEQRGDIDVVLFHDDGSITVRDWKTGRKPTMKSARATRQVQWYAAVAALHFGVSRVHVELVYFGNDPREVDEATFDFFDLCGLRECLRQDLREMEGRRLPVVGDHCRGMYCPIVTECDAMKATAAAIELASKPKYEFTALIENDDMLRELYPRAGGLMEACKRVLGACDKYVKDARRPVDMGNGTMLAEVIKTGGEKVHMEPEMLRILDEMLGDGASEAATQKKVTKSGIDKVISERVKHGQRKKIKEAILNKGRELGLVKAGRPYTVVEVVSRGKDATSNE